jgi:ribosomal protein S4E
MIKKATKTQIEVIEKLLLVGQARVDGKTCDGYRWPEGVHYWIVNIQDVKETYHVPLDTRPHWSKYDRIQ